MCNQNAHGDVISDQRVRSDLNYFSQMSILLTCQFVRMCCEDRLHHQHRSFANLGRTVERRHTQSVKVFYLEERASSVISQAQLLKYCTVL